MKYTYSLLLALCLWLPGKTMAQSLVSIAPNSYSSDGGFGQFTVTASGTTFTAGNVLWASLNLYTHYDKSTAGSIRHSNITWQVTNSTTLQLYYSPILNNLYPGWYDVEVMTTSGLLKLDSAFQVTATPPDEPFVSERFLRAGNVHIYPNYGTPGQTLDVVVTGKGAQFVQASSALAFDFDTPNGLPTFATAISHVNDTTLLASVTIPASTAVGKYDYILFTRFNGAPTINNGFRVVSSLPTPPLGSIQGIVINDKNKNCTQSAGENGFVRRVVRALPGPYYAITNANGAYNLRLPYGTYNVNRVETVYYDPVCQLTGLASAPSAGNPTLTGRNFADTSYNCSLKVRVLETGSAVQEAGNCNAGYVILELKGRPGRNYNLFTRYEYGGDTTYGTTTGFYYGQGYSGRRVDTIRLTSYFGKYKFVAWSEGGCRDSVYFPIDPPTCDAELTLQGTTPNTGTEFSAGCNGTIKLHLGSSNPCSNGWLRHHYRRPDGTYFYSYHAGDDLNVNANSDAQFNNLQAGDYMITFSGGLDPNCHDTVYATVPGNKTHVKVVATQASPGSRTIHLVTSGWCGMMSLTTRNLTTGQGGNGIYPWAYTYYDIAEDTDGAYEVTVVELNTGDVAKDTVYLNVPPSQWPITFGSTGDDYTRGVVRDTSGNVYVSMSFRGTINLAGTSLTSTSSTRRDMALAKFNPNGTLLWVRKMGNGQFDMEPQGVNLDGSGNVYWAGSFAGGVTFPNATTGVGLTAAGSYDAFTARFDPATGNCVWAKRVGGPGNDYLYGCFVSKSGNVYAGGSYTGAISFQTGATSLNLTNVGGLDAFIVKFDPNGNGIWASHAGSTGNDEVKSIEYNGGDLVACGYMGNNCTFPGVSAPIILPSISASRDGWAARINSVGQYVWVKNFGTIFNDEAQSICYDASTGNVFLAAQVADAPMVFNDVSYPGKGNNDIAVVGWNFYTQAPVWAKRVGSTTGDAPSSIRWDGNRIVVAGYAGGNVNTGSFTLNTNGVQDAIVMRYDKTTGAITSGLMIGGPGDDRATTMYCNIATREEFVGGVFSGAVTFPGAVPRVSTGLYDGFLVRVTPPAGLRLGEKEIATAASGKLSVYPVPASHELRIALSDNTIGTPQAYDAKGTRITLSFHVEGSEGVLDVGPLQPGIYVLRMGGKTARFAKE